MARLTESPFIKVEATKFTEVGYVGRDVESILRDLLEQTITELHEDRVAEVEPTGAGSLPTPGSSRRCTRRTNGQRAGRALPGDSEPEPAQTAADARRARARRRRLASRLAAGALEDASVEIEVEEPFQPAFEGFTGTGLEEVGVSLSDFFSQLAPSRKRKEAHDRRGGSRRAHRRGDRPAHRYGPGRNDDAFTWSRTRGGVHRRGRQDLRARIRPRTRCERRGRCSATCSDPRGLDRAHTLRAGAHRPRPLHRSRRVHRGPAQRPDPRVSRVDSPSVSN